jgi:phosphatidylglycerophosphatase A
MPWAAIIGGWEIVLLLAIGLIIIGGKRLPDIARGLHDGFDSFKRASDEVGGEIKENLKDGHDKKYSGMVYAALTVESRTVDFVYAHEPAPSPLRNMILILAQGFGIGRIPFAPGTFGSLLGILWFAALVGSGNYWCFLAGTLGGIALSISVCGAAEKILQRSDPPSVVLDEIVAMPICFLPLVTQSWLSRSSMPPIEMFFSGRTLLYTILIFALFRLFDIAKPWPVRQSQKLPGGWGVTVDDVLAAVYVAILTLFLPV